MTRKHGTFRPNLAKLVAGNSEERIHRTTKDAFAAYGNIRENYTKAIKILCVLKGIGAATASLLLSCYDPVNMPFFSDELYRYALWGDAKHYGWDRNINYNPTSYRDLIEEFEDIQNRLRKKKGKTIKAIDLEKVAYVIAKEAQQEAAASKNDHLEEIERPPSPKRRKKETPELEETSTQACLRKGPNGSPTYDHLGYELDYNKIAKSYVRPRRPGKRAEAEDKRRAEIMQTPSEKVSAFLLSVWDDRVARDLGKPFHKVVSEDFEEWQKKGFSVAPGELQNLSQEERDRISNLVRGAGLRK